MEIALIIIGLAVIITPIFLYNSLISKKNTVKESYSGIEVQLKRRYDLIPNLVNTVKGYAKHEKETFENITKARTQAMSSSNIHEKAKAENEISDTLKSLFAVAENYPALKADQNFLHLQQELSDTEDKLSASRRFYNGAVNSFNTAIESIPTNIIASIFKFQKSEFFEIEASEKEQAKNPTKIKF
ncbi:MAG: LemA family protein [Candidatus Gracilibacteria bacterium]|jgi:LemA protein|nr:LemA family protein [Candidatus Gracilibacteria bacterium]